MTKKPQRAASKIPAKNGLSKLKVIRRRARSESAKNEVREAIIAIGRHAFATQPFEAVSLRSIAAAAGYSTSVMYRLYADRQALFLAIREADLEAALLSQERLAMRVKNPEERIRKLFLHAVSYWIANEDQYQVLYGRPRNRMAIRYQDGSQFGQSPLVARGVTLWERALSDLFETFPSQPVPIRRATDCVLLAMHAVISVPSRLQSRDWTPPTRLANEMINLLLSGWQANCAKEKR